MTRKNLIRLAVVLAIVEVVALVVVYAGDTNAEAAGNVDPMEAWLASITPGDPHAELANQAGSWNYVITFWMEPGADPGQLEGVSKKTMIMGGRYLQEELTGEFMGQPFNGFGITGYDNVTGEYVSIWLDNMSTAIHFYTGQEAADGTHVYTSESHDPATGRAIPMRSVSRNADANHHSFESFRKLPDGSEFLQMRVEYTRAAD